MGTDQSIKAAEAAQENTNTTQAADELNDAQLDRVSAGFPPQRYIQRPGHTSENSVTIKF